MIAESKQIFVTYMTIVELDTYDLHDYNQVTFVALIMIYTTLFFSYSFWHISWQQSCHIAMTTLNVIIYLYVMAKVIEVLIDFRVM